MKRILNLCTALIVLVACTVSCKKSENFDASKIDILFTAPELNIDLNLADNPPVVCVVNSENPLREVRMFIVKGDAEEPLGKVIASFFNDKSCSIREMPVYREDMTGVRIVAVDAAGEVKERTLPFVIKPMQNAPEITFSVDALTVTEGSPIPHFTAAITAESPLVSVRFLRVVNRVESAIVDPVEVFPTPTQYRFEIEEMEHETVFEPGITSFKIEAVDAYGKIKIATLPVIFVELPYPVVTFNQTGTIDADEFEPLTISGSISGYSNLVRATYTLIGKDVSVPNLAIDDVVLPIHTANTTFSYTIPSMSSDYKGFEVSVTDARNKVTASVKNITVTAYPAPQIATPTANYYGIAGGSQISLAGNTITSAPANITNVTITTTDLSGTRTEVFSSDMDVSSYTPTTAIPANATLAGIEIKAVNAKGKTTTINIPVSVDCWLLTGLILQERATGATNAASSTQLCIFSSVARQVLSLDAAFARQADCDFTLYTTSNPAGSVRFVSLSRADVEGKFNNATYGFAKWTTRNQTKIAVAATIPATDFFKQSADDIKGLPDLTAPDPGANAGSSMGIGRVSDADPTVQIVYFETVARSGKIQRGIIKYEGIGNSSPNQNASTNTIYNVSMILTTPY